MITSFTEVGCQSFAKGQLIQGVLLTFQQLCSQSLQSVLSLSTLKLVGWLLNKLRVYGVENSICLLLQVFCFTISALLYCDGNTIVSALESLYQLLLSVDAEFEGWLLSTNLPMQVTKLHSVYIMSYF